MTSNSSGWYGVRCLFQWTGWDGEPFEERVTLWRAESSAAAIALAAVEAAEYAAEHGFVHVDLAQCYFMGAQTPGHGAEVFSLLRDSELPAAEYLDAFFDTGREHQNEYDDDSGTSAR